jgi:hypothetical protein
MGRLGLLFDLATMDPVHQSDAAAALRLLTNPPLSNDTLHMALGCLGSLSPADALPLAKRLVLLAIDEDVDHPLPHLIVHSVDSVVPDHHAEASADSVLTLRDSLGSPVRRQIAALSLASDVAHRPEAVRYLADSLTNRRLPSSDRGRLVASTRQYAVGEPRITDAYRSFLLDPTAVTWLRITVAHALLTSVPDGRVIAIPALRAIADDRLTFPDARSHAIRTLRAMKVATSEQADAAEQVVAGDVYLPVATRAYAYLRLAETGGMALDKVVDRLTALLAAGYGTFNERLEAAMDAATRSTPAVRLSIVAALNRTGWRSAQTGDEAPSSYAAARLVQLLGPSASEAIGYVAWSAEAATDTSGWEYQTGLLGVLDQTTRQRLLTIEDPGKAHPTAVDRLLRTARRLVLLAPDRRPEAAAALRQLLGRPDLRPDQRLEAVWQLSKLDIDDVAHAAHLLNATIREGARDLDPLDAAALLYRDFISERPAAGAYLRAVAADQDESHTRRRAACDVLLDSGGRRALRTAADVLREFLTDPRLGLDERLLAGQRLAEICAGAYDDVRDVFLSMHPPQPAGRVRIATALLTLDAADQAAIDRLCEIAGDPQTPARACREAARFLSGDVPLYRRALVPVLLGRISGGPTPADAVWLHQCLATVLPEAVPSSVAALQRLAAAGEALVRIEAATALLPFGTAEIGARQVLWEILNCAEVPGHLRVLAGRRLVTRPGALAGALHDTLLALPGSTDDQIRAALVLLGYPGPPSDRATAALRTLLARADVAAHLRLTAAEALAGQDDPDGQACAIAVFAEAGADASLHPWLRFRAIAWLGRHDGRRTNEAFDLLQEFLICPDADLEQRRWAAEALGDLDGMQRRVARDALLRHDGDALDDRARRRLRRSAATI